MTATLAARLVEAGRIQWDSTVAQVLGELGGGAYASVTLADLLVHRSGLPANCGRLDSLRFIFDDGSRDLQADRRRYAASVLSTPPSVARGTYLYSNAGYVVASLLLETAARAPFETAMQEEVFDPLGMTNVGWGPPPADQPQGHTANLFGTLRCRRGFDNPPVLNAAGRVHTTISDYLSFLHAHLVSADGPFLSAGSWSRLHDPVGTERYAMGWGVKANGDYGHSGSNTAWLAQEYVSPARRVALVAIVNDGRMERQAPLVNQACVDMLSVVRDS
jgi:CubicO group peptidase (beta-lactamase class C family)